MKAIIQEEAGGELYFREVEKPKPGKGEVLVKMSATPINPSDLSFMEGSFGEKPEYPVIPGIEGSGIVVEAGSGIIPKMRLNKRVSCISKSAQSGTWAEYMLTDATKCIPVDDSIDDIQAASLLVNPLTALAFIDIAKKENHKAFVNNAAASSLGKMLNVIADEESINIINIVRRQEQVENLKKLGIKYILNSSDKDYKEKLKEICHKFNIKLYFDAIGGTQTNELLTSSPNNSTIVVYAKLDKSNIELNPQHIIQKGKKVLGFSLGNYAADKSLFKSLKDVNKIKKMMGNKISTKVYKTFKLKEIDEAINDYRANMSKGKVFIEF